MKRGQIILFILISLHTVVRGQSIAEDPNPSSPGENTFNTPPSFVPKRNYVPRGVNPRELHPFGIYANIGGPGILGGSVDYFLRSYIELEAGGGMNAAFAGMHYHITGGRNIPWTPYAGFLVTYTYHGSKPGVYIPGGFQMVQFSGFGLRFEAALWIQQGETGNSDSPLTDIEFFGYLRFALGYHF